LAQAIIPRLGRGPRRWFAARLAILAEGHRAWQNSLCLIDTRAAHCLGATPPFGNSMRSAAAGKSIAMKISLWPAADGLTSNAKQERSQATAAGNFERSR
jgi:hypothetical protein